MRTNPHDRERNLGCFSSRSTTAVLTLTAGYEDAWQEWPVAGEAEDCDVTAPDALQADAPR